MSVFTEALEKTGLPAEALKPIADKLNEAWTLTLENNKRVAQVLQAKDADPNNTEFLDTLWKSHVADDPDIQAIEPEFQAAAEAYERALAKLRGFAKKHIPEQLSEEQAAATRKLVNDSAKAIETARSEAAVMSTIADQMLILKGAAIEGGIITLLPEIESLKNTRGRKAATGEKGQYMTRVGDIQFDGKSTNILVNGESKGKFNYAADFWNKEFNSEAHAGNAITGIELEEAFFKALGKEFRSVTSTEIPETFEFTFTKDIEKQNPNDDKTTKAPITKKVTVVRAPSKAKVADTKPEATETPKPEEAKGNETPKANGETPVSNNQPVKPAEAKGGATKANPTTPKK